MIKDKNIVLGVSGSIAAYKAAEVASQLVQLGAKVEVVMTESSRHFVGPLTFSALTGREVYTSFWEGSGVRHIELASKADLILIAPATANIIAMLAQGLASDLITSLVLATRAPVLLAPAMESNMYLNTITQENISKLKDRGFVFIGPDEGHLASGGKGVGRLAMLEDIIGAVSMVLGRDGVLGGRTVVVTAGGTHEPIDPVRYVANRSSGKMGYALALGARDRGARVRLISGPTCLKPPYGVEFTAVKTAAEMKEATFKAVEGADALFMAAAVADFKSARVLSGKLKRESGGIILEMEATEDILAGLKGDFVKVGFALETGDVVEQAREKLERKGLDLIVANGPESFESDFIKATLISHDSVEDLPLMSKADLADLILDRAAELITMEKNL
jgi:phosphopantothenoylcysteine decarboxylase/phosphopantothenate--cysteine ligase